ncbi:MAG: hypothetical protein CMH27_04810 [Micavibrio sp.]|nr:hypothetical protein [Micavibrio sp.]
MLTLLFLRYMRTKMGQHLPVTDFDIQALIDHELSQEDEKRVKAFLKTNACAQKRYNDLKEQKALIQKWANNSFFH